ncbi:uncharacterized mitochondrial protein-like protein [Tanacetum coccineum]
MSSFEKMMHKKFQMSSIGELTFFLGLQVKQKEDGIFISQDKYVTEILKKFGFTDVKTASTPMETQKPLLKDEDGEEVDVHLYRSMIGSLMYLTSSRPDIMFAVCACARYQVNPKVSHLHAVKRIFRDSNEKKLIQMIKIHTEKNVADLLTKAFDVKTVNVEPQLQALVDGKKIIITEATIRRDRQLEDADGVDCLPNAIIFEQLTLMGQGKDFSGRVTPLLPTMVVQAQEEIGKGSVMPTDPHHTPIITQPQRKQKSRRPKEKDTQVPYSSVPSDPKNIADEAVNEEPSMQLKELMDFYTKLQQRVLDLENTKTAQAQEITSLKKRVKKLEKKVGSRTHKLKRLYRGRKINDIDANEDITLENIYDADMFGVNDLDGDEVVVESKVTNKAGEKRYVVEEAVVVTDAVTIPVSAATITNVELTLAQTLAELKSARPKTKGVVMQETSESTPIITLQLSSHVKGQGSKDKGKAKMIEPEKPLKKIDQIKFNEEEALRLLAKFDEEDRLAREKAQQVEEADIAWDDIQAKIDADYQLAERLQAQKQQELTMKRKREERIAREKEEANAALIAQWNDIQDKVETDYELAQRLQAEEQEELTIEEKSKLFQ